MARRRMFSPDIVCSDAFFDMPASSRELYFQLGMKADDDGFVNPRGTMRLTGAPQDDLSLLIAKSFILPFQNGVIVIKHWRMSNRVRTDWYTPTQYIDEKNQLYLKENGAYTKDSSKGLPLGADSVPTRSRSIGKYSIGIPADAASIVPEEGEFPKKRERKDKEALALMYKYYGLMEKEQGVRPTETFADYNRVLEAKKILKDGDIDNIVEDALAKGKARTLREMLTNREIDIYRQENL